MKSTASWTDNGDGTNTSDFSALPSGRLPMPNSIFDGLGIALMWRSTDNSSAGGWARYLDAHSTSIDRFYSGKDAGLSVRCVKN